MNAKERFLQSIRDGDLRAVRRWLGHDGVKHLRQFEYPENSYNYPLDVAIDTCGKTGTSPVFRLLVENKFQLNDEDRRGYRCIIRAASLQNIDALAFMVNHGAKLTWPQSGPENWCSAIQGLSARGRGPNGPSPCEDPKFEATLRWLIRNGCSLNGLSFGLLHAAVDTGHHELVRLLVKLGANVNEVGHILVGNRRGTPLHAYNGPYGSENGYLAVEALLEAGADPYIKNDKGLDASSYLASLIERTRGSPDGVEEIVRVVRLIDPSFQPAISSDRQFRPQPLALGEAAASGGIRPAPQNGHAHWWVFPLIIAAALAFALALK